QLLCVALNVYTIVLFLRIVLSWVTMFWSPPSSLSPAVRVIYDLTEPVMRVFRRYIPAIGGFDLSPLFIFIIIGIIQRAIGCPGAFF
ncbi:MAG TPA: YggT family protein, partial [Actinomycetota bacterium]|nr:YggT family protein [Actinomycetota bacterium]